MMGQTVRDTTTMLFVPPSYIQEMEWVGASTSMALGVFRSVRTLATIFRVVSVWFLVFKQVGGSEI